MKLPAAAAASVPLVHRSATMGRLIDLARRVARTDANILLVGESGTGKGTLARFIHDASPRHSGPFVTITCANIPADLLESELFGHEKGAFTGAADRRSGRFEQADGGTILIDGVHELAPALQGKLLRVVQERAFERLAGTETLHVNVRILASAQVDLEPLVASGAFRKDLFFRLNVVRIDLPPLRERPEDLEALTAHLLEEQSRRQGGAALRLSPGARRRLREHDWPGNVRELQNVIESACILTRGPEIAESSLRLGAPRDADPVTVAGARRESLAQVEERYIREILRVTGGNQTRAARILGISRKTLLEKRKRYGMS